MDKKKVSKVHLDFESSLKELEKIAERLESGDLGLEDSIKEFEKGMEYAKYCHEKLEEAENKIMILQKGKNNQVKSKNLKINNNSEMEDDEDIQGTLL